MRFSIWLGAGQSWDEIAGAARHAEQTGWDGIWIADHFMGLQNPADPIFECMTLIAALAAVVPRVRIGSLVAGNTYRHPAVLAKMATTIDSISGGRLVLGLGAGWQQNEHEAYGIEFFDVPGRLRRLEDACHVIRSLGSAGPIDHDGRYYRLEGAYFEPPPVQARIPLLVGGGGEKVTMRIAAQYGDQWNIWGVPERLRTKGAVLDVHCERLGRDPASIHRSAQALLLMSEDAGWVQEQRSQRRGPQPTLVGTPEEILEAVHEFAAVGVDEFIVPDFTLGTGARKRDAMDLFIERVAAAAR